MHMVIRAIVFAKDQEEALENAKTIFDGLCYEGGPFDYFTTFDGPGSVVSGRGRYGDIIPVAKADSPKGKELIDEGWKSTVSDFMNSMKKVRRIVKHLTDEQIMEDKFIEIPDEESLHSIRYQFNKIGQYEGSEIWLYDNDGSGICDKSHLDSVLNKWSELDNFRDEYKDLDVWVVPADVHH